jgi:hypothetical protein
MIVPFFLEQVLSRKGTVLPPLLLFLFSICLLARKNRPWDVCAGIRLYDANCQLGLTSENEQDSLALNL